MCCDKWDLNQKVAVASGWLTDWVAGVFVASIWLHLKLMQCFLFLVFFFFCFWLDGPFQKRAEGEHDNNWQRWVSSPVALKSSWQTTATAGRSINDQHFYKKKNSTPQTNKIKGKKNTKNIFFYLTIKPKNQKQNKQKNKFISQDCRYCLSIFFLFCSRCLAGCLWTFSVCSLFFSFSFSFSFSLAASAFCFNQIK